MNIVSDKYKVEVMGARGHCQDGKFTGIDMCWGASHRGGTWVLQGEEWCAHTSGRRVQVLVGETSGWEGRGVKGGGKRESCMGS